MDSLVKTSRNRISSTEFGKHAIAGEFKRVGKNIIFIDGNGSHIPVSAQNMQHFKTCVMKDKKTVIIKANGLSRSQVGRIASDLNAVNNRGVYIRRIPSSKTSKLQITNFEILVMGEHHETEEKPSSL